MIDILLALGLDAQAELLLDQVREADDPVVVLLAARVAFRRRQYARVRECCRRLSQGADALSPRVRKAVAYWAGETDG